MTLGWGIVGIGWHANSVMAPAIDKACNARLAAVCSRDLGRAQAFAKAHGAPQSYSSYGEMLRDPEVKAVYVATPNAHHRDHTVQAARAGRHVLCEKPMALNVTEAADMVQACRDAGVKLGVSLQNRFQPAHVEMRRLIESGEAGKPLLLLGEYSVYRTEPASPWKADPSVAGGGAIVGAGVHLFDLFRFLSGQEVVEVVARVESTLWDFAVDDTVLAILKFSGNVWATMASVYQVPRAYNSVVAHCSKARLTGLDTVGMSRQGTLRIEGDEGLTKIEFPTDDPATDNFVQLIEGFVRAIEEGTELRASGEDGLELVRIVEAVQESAVGGRNVTIHRDEVAQSPRHV